MKEVVDTSARGTIKTILEDKGIKQTELAEMVHVTKQNMNNKMSRDNFSTLELVEIADALDMNKTKRRYALCWQR